MRKIFRYELRRAVCNKFFLGLLVVCLFFGWQTLNGEVIQGVAHTAPFSAWSFGYYLAQELPLLSVALLFFLWNVFSKEGPPGEHFDGGDPRGCGKLSFGEMRGCCNGLAAVGFRCVYAWNHIFACAFRPSRFLKRFAPSCFDLPAAGAGSGIGDRHDGGTTPSGAASCAGACGTGGQLTAIAVGVGSLWSNLFSEYPLTLTQLDPAFALPAAGWIAKAVYLAVGVGFAALAVHLERKTVLKGLQS